MPNPGGVQRAWGQNMFGALSAADGIAPEALIGVARGFSPRIEIVEAGGDVVLDLAGLARLFGDAGTIADELRRAAADRGLRVRIAVAPTRTAARLLVRHHAGVTVVRPGDDVHALSPLPIAILAKVHASAAPHPGSACGPDPDDPAEMIATLQRWGVRTLGAFAALPADAVAARLGQRGVRWQRVAGGEDLRPLVPSVPEERFEEAIDLEWPIDGLEPLSFVLGRLLEPLSAHLARRDRGAAVLHVRLHLVTRDVHVRTLQLPVPMREARTLRTLLLLDLESHAPPAAIDRVVVAVDPTPARVVQFSLLTRPVPPPEQVSTLMARLQALMGESRCGAPATVDSWAPGAFAMKPFAPVESRADAREDRAIEPATDPAVPAVALRRFRQPVIARVRVDDGRPVRVATDRAGIVGGSVVAFAGPWRTSGAWWTDPREARVRDATGARTGADGVRWDRDEWEVTLSDGGTYRLFRERDTERWFVEGVID